MVDLVKHSVSFWLSSQSHLWCASQTLCTLTALRPLRERSAYQGDMQQLLQTIRQVWEACSSAQLAFQRCR